jgi:hypothetical protein
VGQDLSRKYKVIKCSNLVINVRILGPASCSQLKVVEGPSSGALKLRRPFFLPSSRTDVSVLNPSFPQGNELDMNIGPSFEKLRGLVVGPIAHK